MTDVAGMKFAGDGVRSPQAIGFAKLTPAAKSVGESVSNERGAMTGREERVRGDERAGANREDLTVALSLDDERADVRVSVAARRSCRTRWRFGRRSEIDRYGALSYAHPASMTSETASGRKDRGIRTPVGLCVYDAGPVGAMSSLATCTSRALANRPIRARCAAPSSVALPADNPPDSGRRATPSAAAPLRRPAERSAACSPLPSRLPAAARRSRPAARAPSRRPRAVRAMPAYSHITARIASAATCAAPRSASGGTRHFATAGSRRQTPRSWPKIARDALGEHEALEQRVRRETIRAVHAGARHLADRVQPRGARRVRSDP